MTSDLSPTITSFAPRSPVDPVEFYGALTIPEALARSGRTSAELIVIDGALSERRIPYREMDARARQVAYALRAREVQPGDRVCLFGTTTAEFLFTLFGVWFAGAVPVVLPLPRRPAEMENYAADIAKRIAAVDARLLAVADTFVGLFDQAETEARQVVPIGELVAEHRTLRGAPPTDPESLALFQFTSGTTASSRAVMLNHRQIMTNIAGVSATCGIQIDDIGVTWLPLNHDMGMVTMLAAVIRGHHRGVIESPDDFITNPLSWPKAISRYRASFTVAPSFAYALTGRLLRRMRGDLDLSSLKWALNGAEPIDLESVGTFTSAAARFGMSPNVICPVYGLAEATLCVTVPPPNQPLAVHWIDQEVLETRQRAVPVEEGTPNARRVVACGYPMPATHVAIRSETGEDLPPGHVGEIQVSGPSVALGYWNDPEATARTITEGWLRTGDLGYVSDDGLVICGREKDMIILNGRNLYPEDFEAAAEEVDKIWSGACVAFVIPGTERMVVVAVPRSKAAEDPATLAQRVLDHLARRLPTAPQEVVISPANEIPRTTSGKRMRHRCRDLYLNGDLTILGRAVRNQTGARPSEST